MIVNDRPDFTKYEANRQKIQAALIAVGKFASPPYDCGPDGADGTMGENTEKALIRFQQDHGLGGVAAINTPLLRALQLESETTVNISDIFGSIFNGLLGNLLNWTLVQSYIRNALMGFGASLVTSGALTGTQLNDGVGALMILLGLIWSILNANRKTQIQQFVHQVADHPAITVIPANQNGTNKPIVTVAKAA